MINIPDEIYGALAARLLREIGFADWFSGAIDLEAEEFYLCLVLTAVVYRRTETAPDGVRHPVTDIVPVRWEVAAVRECGCVPNDFSFRVLKPYLIEHGY